MGGSELRRDGQSWSPYDGVRKPQQTVTAPGGRDDGVRSRSTVRGAGTNQGLCIKSSLTYAVGQGFLPKKSVL